MFLEQRPGGAKEALICTVSLFASLMFVLALYLGRWMIQTAGSDVMRWRMGMLGTTIIWGELFISVNLVFWNAWSALRYFTH
jgi:hypothetical protein